MKKFLLLMVAAVMSLTAWADAKVENGSMRDLKNPEVRVLVTWDYSKMMIEDKKPADFLKEKGADWERDYPAEVAAGFSAGSMPTIGIVNVCRSISAAALVAVLHAMTMAFTPSPTMRRAMAMVIF